MPVNVAVSSSSIASSTASYIMKHSTIESSALYVLKRLVWRTRRYLWLVHWLNVQYGLND